VAFVVCLFNETYIHVCVYVNILLIASTNGISNIKTIYYYFFVTDCGLPPFVVNATAALNSTTLLGSTATYTCDVGFVMNGSGVINCLSSGWEAEPICVTGSDCLNAHCLILFVFTSSVFGCLLTLIMQYLCFKISRYLYYSISI